MTEFEAGFITALFVADAHFGGDGKQPQVTLRMHVKEEPLFRWLLDRLPAGKLYGPYEYTYKDGGVRRFFQLMYRGEALKEQLIPFLKAHDWSKMAPAAHERFQAMIERYRL